jgi:hypothetical protein
MGARIRRGARGETGASLNSVFGEAHYFFSGN